MQKQHTHAAIRTANAKKIEIDKGRYGTYIQAQVVCRCVVDEAEADRDEHNERQDKTRRDETENETNRQAKTRDWSSLDWVRRSICPSLREGGSCTPHSVDRYRHLLCQRASTVE